MVDLLHFRKILLNSFKCIAQFLDDRVVSLYHLLSLLITMSYLLCAKHFLRTVMFQVLTYLIE